MTAEQMTTVFQRLLPNGITREDFAIILSDGAYNIIYADPGMKTGADRAEAFIQKVRTEDCSREWQDYQDSDNWFVYYNCECRVVKDRVDELRPIVEANPNNPLYIRERGEFSRLRIGPQCWDWGFPSTTTTIPVTTTQPNIDTSISFDFGVVIDPAERKVFFEADFNQTSISGVRGSYQLLWDDGRVFRRSQVLELNPARGVLRHELPYNRDLCGKRVFFWVTESQTHYEYINDELYYSL